MGLVSKLLLWSLEVWAAHCAAAGSPVSASRRAKQLLKCLLIPIPGEHGGTCMAALLHFGASPNPGPFLTVREAAAAIAAAAAV